jgi:hypothetical protein
LSTNSVIKNTLELINENANLMDIGNWKFSETGETQYYYVREGTG